MGRKGVMFETALSLTTRFAWCRLRVALAASLALVGVGCNDKRADKTDGRATSAAATPSAKPTSKVTSYSYEVVNTWPHDPEAFTQGLVYLKGVLIESTGLEGRSTLRKVDPTTGRVREQVKLAPQFFAEGIAVLGEQIFQLTWQNQIGFIYDVRTFEKRGEFSYRGEGWGLTTDGVSLIMSDGSNELRFIEPATFKVTRTLQVFNQAGEPLKFLNELEFIRGEIYANVWQTPYVVRIDPANGKLTGVVDFSGLLAAQDRSASTDVLNGIAYDEAGDRIFVTGKNWPKLFEVRLKAQ